LFDKTEEMKTGKKTSDKKAQAEKQRSESERKARLISLMVCIGVSALAVVPFFFMGESREKSDGLQLQMPVTHDMHLHFEQMKSFHNGLSSGELYPRWEEDTNRGFGAPTTAYYPPGIYYLTSAFYSLTQDWTRSLLNVHLLMMIASAGGLYLYARRSLSRPAAMVAMVSYIFLPYHLIDQYQRGAIAELLGFVWMPLMLLFAERVFDRPAGDSAERPFEGRKKLSFTLMAASGLAACLGAFLWSHPPTAYQFLLAFGLFSLGLAWMKKDFKGLLLTGCGVALGLALSAAYLYPAAVEQDLIRREYVADSWPYHETYVFLHNLPYAQYHRGFFNLIDSTWTFGAVAIALAAIILLIIGKQSFASLRQRVLLWTLIGVFAGFMMTALSYPIGRLIPKIDIGVFTWRMLSMTTLSMALLAGACMQAAMSAVKRSDKLLTLATAGFIMIGGIVMSFSAVIAPPLRAPVFVPEAEHFNDAMIPRSAPKNPRELPKVERVELAEGKGAVSVEKWDTEHRLIRAEMKGEDRLLIRTFDFPGWQVTVDGQTATVSEGEAIRVEFSDGEQALIRALTYRGGDPVVYGEQTKAVGREMLGDIALDYIKTPARRTGVVISIVSLVILIACASAAFVIGRSRDDA
jgi:hypothetical protein